MPCQSGLSRNGGRLAVTYFPDHDNIRVLPQYRAQTFSKGVADICVCLYLNHAVHVIFDGIFDRDNLTKTVIEALKTAVKGRRFT